MKEATEDLEQAIQRHLAALIEDVYREPPDAMEYRVLELALRRGVNLGLERGMAIMHEPALPHGGR